MTFRTSGRYIYYGSSSYYLGFFSLSLSFSFFSPLSLFFSPLFLFSLLSLSSSLGFFPTDRSHQHICHFLCLSSSKHMIYAFFSCQFFFYRTSSPFHNRRYCSCFCTSQFAILNEFFLP
jgi:hypothetical protein